MSKSSSKRSIEDLEKQLVKKNTVLNEKYLELETLLDLTNTINSLDDLNDKELEKIDKRSDGEVEVIDVKLNNRKTKNAMSSCRWY